MTNDRKIKAIALISALFLMTIISTRLKSEYLQEHVMLAVKMNSLDSTPTASISNVTIADDHEYDLNGVDSRVIGGEDQDSISYADFNNTQTLWRGHIAMPSISQTPSHPHRGALHPNGTIGMIVDPTPGRLRSFDPNNHRENLIQHSVLCPLSANSRGNNSEAKNNPSFGIEGAGGRKVLQKIKNGIMKSKEFLKLQQNAIEKMVVDPNKNQIVTNLTTTVPIPGNTTARAKRSKILCMVYTVHFPPKYENHNLRAQAETWGGQCDGFIAASNFTDHGIGSINLPHIGPETYGNMWQKVRSMWAYAYDHYRDEFDFFHICGDDVYVVVDNLRAYLDGPEVTQLENGHCDHFYRQCTWTPDRGPRPLYFGASLLWKGVVPAGGPGYTLNRAALDILVEDLLPTFCHNSTDSREDVFVGSAFAGAGIYLSRTVDASGGERYGGTAEGQYNFIGIGPGSPTRVAKRYGLPPPVHGINGTSEQFISFHLKQKEMNVMELIYRYHAILNDRWCD